MGAGPRGVAAPWAGVGAVLWGLTACGANVATEPRDAANLGDAGGDAGGSDGDLPDVGPGVTLTLGTGLEGFAPLVAGSTLAFQRGPQGGDRYNGFHLWVAFKSQGLSPEGLTARWTLRDPAASALIGEAEYQLQLRPVEDGLGAFGMRVVIRDCCVAENRALSLHLLATDRRGIQAEAQRAIHTGECPTGRPNPTFDPCPP